MNKNRNWYIQFGLSNVHEGTRVMEKKEKKKREKILILDDIKNFEYNDRSVSA